MTKRATSKPVKSKAAVKPKAAPKAATAAVSASKTASAKSKPTRPAAKSAVAAKTTAPKASATAGKPRTQAIDKAKDKKLTAKAGTSTIVLPPDYRPSEDEPFMNERQRLYFRQKLQGWKEEIIRQTKETLAGLHEDSTQHADLADRATSETDRALELRARDRQRKLIAKIDAALARIEDGTYGYCEETGEPIGLKRLDARPIATLSLEAQERHERRERVYRED
nr:RNA polymerase-binding protein DksA [Hyphomicrobium sp. CS1GBMeth3]